MRQAILTVDLGFGDSGKGSIVDFLTRFHEAHTVVRFNGGAQAGHRVVTAEPAPREHVFAQFGSGTLAGADTHLSRFMLLDPLAMVEEEKHLRALGVADAFQRTTIDEQALVLTPFQRAVNRLRELARGDGRHGSCGMGIGETMVDYLAHGRRVLCAGDLTKPDLLRAKLAFLREVNLAKVEPLRQELPDSWQVERELEWLLDPGATDWLVDAYHDFMTRARVVSGDHLHTILRQPGSVVFEAAQGVLLDEWRGFHPYTTWSTTTLENAARLLAEAGYQSRTTSVGITRAYTTRHGSGPLVTEDEELTQVLPDARNFFGTWQRGFRVGWLDLVLLRYAVEVAGPLDYLALTCLDRLDELPEPQICRGYRYVDQVVEHLPPALQPHDLEHQELLTRMLEECRPILEPLGAARLLPGLLAHELGVPVGITSYGPTADDKRFVAMPEPDEMTAEIATYSSIPLHTS